MKLEFFIAGRMIRQPQGGARFSKPVVNVAILSITLGLGVMILAISIVKGFQGAITEKLTGIAAHIQITSLENNYSLESKPIDGAIPISEGLQSDTRIKHIQRFATKNTILKTKTDIQGVLLKGVGPDFDGSFFKQNIVSGEMITPADTGIFSREVVISKIIADRLKIQVGDSMYTYYLSQLNDSVRARSPSAMRLHVRGIYETGMYEMDQGLILGDLRLVQAMYKWAPNQVSGFEVMLHNYDDVATMADLILFDIPSGLYASSIMELYPGIFEWLPTVDQNSTIIIVLMIAVSIMAMISTLLILILEKSNMIGILKALGMRNWPIQIIFLYQAGYIILRGVILGNILGLGLCWVQDRFKILKLDQESYYLPDVPIYYDWGQFLAVNVLTVGICLTVLLIPSYLVARISPLKAIRMD